METIEKFVILSGSVAIISVINVFMQSCVSHPTIYAPKNGYMGKFSKIVQLFAMSLVAIALVSCSFLPLCSFHPTKCNQAQELMPGLDKMEKLFHKYHIAHDWGMLRKMRSERLELEFQYTYDDASDVSVKPVWKTYDVAYRPISRKNSMPFAGPYYSRFDFRFHEAVGQGAKFEKNLWLAGLTKQLLRNSPAALKLLSRENVKTVLKPPKFVRLAFVRLSYAPLREVSYVEKSDFWIRKVLNADYIPPMKKDNAELKELVETLNASLPKKKETVSYPKLLEILKKIRNMFDSAVDGHIVVIGFLVTCLILCGIRRNSSV